MATLLNTIEDKTARNVCAAHADQPDALLEILHDVQAKAGYLSQPALRTIAQALNLTRADVHGVVTFYHDFKLDKPAAQTLKICRAEACQAVGANDLIRDAEAYFGTALNEKADKVALEATYCLGNCALGPAVMVEDTLYGRVDLNRLKTIAKMHSGDAE